MNIKFQDSLERDFKIGFLTLYLHGCDIDTLIKSFTCQKDKILNQYPNSYNFTFDIDTEEGQPQIVFILPKNKKELEEDKQKKDLILKDKIEKAKKILKDNNINV